MINPTRYNIVNQVVSVKMELRERVRLSGEKRGYFSKIYGTWLANKAKRLFMLGKGSRLNTMERASVARSYSLIWQRVEPSSLFALGLAFEPPTVMDCVRDRSRTSKTKAEGSTTGSESN